jgi:hypothetical protein
MVRDVAGTEAVFVLEDADILWSYFSIFLVSTRACLYSNVPSIEESEAK